MSNYTMRDIIPLLGLPTPPHNRTDYNVTCPCCDTSKRGKHLNINLAKNVFRCPRCDFNGGVFDLYAQMTGCERKKVRSELDKVLGGQQAIRRPKPIPKDGTPKEPEMEIYTPTDIEARDRTFRKLLEMLPLFSNHEENLLARGLSKEAIEKFGYRSVPQIGHDILAKKLQAAGCYLSGVPGFHRNKDGEWTLVKSKQGILVPVRDRLGRIQGIQIRLDNTRRRKFRWMSSNNRQDGCRSDGWVHMAGPVREEIILIEGPMKADIVFHLTGQTVLAVPGVNSLTMLEDTLCELRELGVRKIMTGFDMDFLNKWTVQNGYWKLVCLLDNMGFEFGTYLWIPDYNGLDDYIWKYMMHSHTVAQ